MTKKENLRRLLRGNNPAWVPCSINFNQWYRHHQRFGSLPEELRGTRRYLDAMRVLGCDVFSRNFDGGYRETFDGVEIRTRTETGNLGPCHIAEIDTPHGTLRHVTEDQPSQTTSYEVEDWVKDWASDGRAYLWLLERLRCSWDKDAFAATVNDIGDDGILMVPVGCTPLKRVQMDLGLDHSCLFVLDEPEAADAICRLYWARVWPVLQEMAGDDRVEVACLMDDVDAPFYPPDLCRRYWAPYVRDAADLFASRGKRIFVHACGKLRRLKQTFVDSHVHGLEGMAHPPIGDWTSRDTLDMPDHFIYNGGFSAQEQVLKTDDQVKAFIDQLFGDLAGFPRFIFAAACQTTVHTPWERLRLVVRLCREHSPIRVDIE